MIWVYKPYCWGRSSIVSSAFTKPFFEAFPSSPNGQYWTTRAGSSRAWRDQPITRSTSSQTNIVDIATEYPHCQWEIHLHSGTLFHSYVSSPECNGAAQHQRWHLEHTKTVVMASKFLPWSRLAPFSTKRPEQDTFKVVVFLAKNKPVTLTPTRSSSGIPSPKSTMALFPPRSHGTLWRHRLN